uniref:Uncharacterized protein n=1 Tax=Timema tahoe TaxID=61484 RepID=A0A7R9P0N0_9NEOP|nr:unnamed protein product [Timema tahoe]
MMRCLATRVLRGVKKGVPPPPPLFPHSHPHPRQSITPAIVYTNVLPCFGGSSGRKVSRGVELVSRTSEHRPSRSESLVIDTHRAPRANVPLLSSPTVPGRSHPLLSVLVSGGGGGGPRQLEAVAGTGAAVLLFLVVVAVLVWRHRRGLRGTDRVGDTDIRGRKLVDELTGSGFQPIVTVVTNPADQPDKGLGFGSFLSSKGFARGCLPASSPSSGISNPLLCPPTPSQDDVYSSSTFLQGAERAARNEVQV